MSNSSSPLIEFFNTQASSYDAGTGGCTRELTKHIQELCAIRSDSVVLDNACGPGIVAQEILSSFDASSKEAPVIYCADAASNMIEIARSVFQNSPHSASIKFDVASGESLPYNQETFSHSITNLGILFFPDAPKGAQEIYRTLKYGGKAVLTTWRDLGYLKLIHHAQRAVRPDAPLFQPPISPEWYKAAHLESTLRQGGFSDINVHEKQVHMGAETVEGIVEHILQLFGKLTDGYDEQEKAKFKSEFSRAASKAARPFTRPRRSSSAQESDIEQLIGIPMIATVAVCTK